MKYTWWLALLILVSVVWLWFQNNWKAVEREELRILASVDEIDRAVPVFAQFVLSQRLKLHEPVLVSRITLPMHVAGRTRDMVIDLRQRGRLLERWRGPVAVASDKPEVAVLQLPFPAPRLMSDELEITIAAAGIDHDHQDGAPRFFIETADSAYPDGNYRIAENEKKGDLSLSIWSFETPLEHWLSDFEHQPLPAVATLARQLLWLTLFVTAPFVLSRIVARTSLDTTPQSAAPQPQSTL